MGRMRPASGGDPGPSLPPVDRLPKHGSGTSERAGPGPGDDRVKLSVELGRHPTRGTLARSPGPPRAGSSARTRTSQGRHGRPFGSFQMRYRCCSAKSGIALRNTHVRTAEYKRSLRTSRMREHKAQEPRVPLSLSRGHQTRHTDTRDDARVIER